ncbi:MAG: WbqC family protein [Pseudomonadota bacterium]
MIVALMQPYFFPYLGYYGLLAAADVFVAYDNVQFEKHGWVNRNRILRDGSPEWWTAPVASAPLASTIAERQYHDWPRHRARLLDRLRDRYRHAPRRDDALDLGAVAMDPAAEGVADANLHGLRSVATTLGLGARIVRASEVPHDTRLRGQDRVLAICAALGADTYVNAIGGTTLYDHAAFAARGIELRFLRARPEPYAQGGGGFVPNLSILDALMFLPVDEVARRVAQFDLVTGHA